MAGGIAAAMIYRQPDQLHAPAWVAYTACAAFVLAGLAIIADGTGAWVAIGAGVRDGSVSVPFFGTVGSELLCRGAFGLGAVIVAALLVWVVLRALRQENGG